jgi:hypothetical protein
MFRVLFVLNAYRGLSGLSRGFAAARLLRLQVLTQLEDGYLFTCFVLSEVSVTGQSFVQRSHTVCDREASTMRKRRPTRDAESWKKM